MKARDKSGRLLRYSAAFFNSSLRGFNPSFFLLLSLFFNFLLQDVPSVKFKISFDEETRSVESALIRFPADSKGRRVQLDATLLTWTRRGGGVKFNELSVRLYVYPVARV